VVLECTKRPDRKQDPLSRGVAAADERVDDLGKRLALGATGLLVLVEDGERALAAGDRRGAVGRAADNLLLVRDGRLAVAERDKVDA